MLTEHKCPTRGQDPSGRVGGCRVGHLERSGVHPRLEISKGGGPTRNHNFQNSESALGLCLSVLHTNFDPRGHPEGCRGCGGVGPETGSFDQKGSSSHPTPQAHRATVSSDHRPTPWTTLGHPVGPEPGTVRCTPPTPLRRGGGPNFLKARILKSQKMHWFCGYPHFLYRAWPFSTVAIENSTGSGPSINSRIPHQLTTPVQPDLLQKMVPYKNSNLPQTPCISRSRFHQIFKHPPPPIAKILYSKNTRKLKIFFTCYRRVALYDVCRNNRVGLDLGLGLGAAG